MLEAVTSQHVETLAKLSAYERATEADRAAASPRPPRSFELHSTVPRATP